MDSKIEQRFRERAVELGNSGDPTALPELCEMTRSPVANIRRLAASAIGKLAGLADAKTAVSALAPMLRDPKPQVRQYAIKALKAYGTASKDILPDLRDIAISPVEKEYNNRDAKLAVETIEEALRIEEKQAVHHCQRCGVELEPDEFVRSQKAFQRPFCNYCFDFDVYIEYWGMDTADYKIGMLKKQQLYQQQGKRLISLYPADKPRIKIALLEKLEQYR